MSDRQLDARSGVGLAVFFGVILCLNRPLRIPVPHAVRKAVLGLGHRLRVIDGVPTQDRRWHAKLELVTAPVVGVALLWASTCIDAGVIRLGIVGDGDIQPYDVLVLFISLAYISCSLDATGGLRALAFFVSQKSGKSGHGLFATLYTFFFLGGVIVGNDPIILSGTPFLAYFTSVAGIVPPTAWIITQFIAANVASAVLVSSNPTNVLIAGAFELNFLTGYTKYTILPTVVCGALALPICWIMFTVCTPRAKLDDRAELANGDSKPPPTSASTPSSEKAKTVERKPSNSTLRYIPVSIVAPDVDARAALLDPPGAIFHTTLLLVTLATLVGTSFVSGHKVAVWMVTMPAGVVALTRDVVSDWWRDGAVERAGAKDDGVDRAAESSVIKGGEAPADRPIDVEDTTPTSEAGPSAPRSNVVAPRRRTLESLWASFGRRFPTTRLTLVRLPVPLVIFAFAMFILVRALDHLGWIAVFATWTSRACTSPARAAFILGPLVSWFLCSLLGTNIGATIAMVSILRHPNFAQSAAVVADPNILRSAIYVTALSSNIGAFSFTFSASLAGLLWVSILAQKGIRVRMRHFAAWNAVPVVLLTLVSSAVVLAELNF